MSDEQEFKKPPQHDDEESVPDDSGSGDVSDAANTPDSDDLAPIDLEPIHDDLRTGSAAAAVPPESRSTIGDLDVCPNCGAALPGSDDVVCMRCGFDLRTLRTLETAATQTADDDTDDSALSDPIAPPDRIRVVLSGALIAVAWVLLLIGYFLGVQSLMPGAELRTVGEGDLAHEIIPPAARLISLLKVLVLTGTLVVCATAGLAMFARLVERPFGDLRAGLLHLTAIASTMQLVRYIGISTRSVEWTLESIAQVAIFLGLSLTLLKLNRRDVLTFALITVIVVLSLFFGSHVLAWAMSS